jgi:hypothetical protein
MATKSPLALVEMPGESSSMTEARQTYIDAQKKMLEALESRNQLFDPVMLAMAQGFLGPTKSGSFGESISNVAAAVGPAAEAERKRNIEMAQIRAELAANQYGAAQKGEALKSFTTAMQPGKPGETITVNGQQYPAQFAGMTPEKATQIGLYDKDLGELAHKYLKAQTEGFAVQPTGTVNLRTPGGPTFTPFPGQANEMVTIPGIGTLSVSKEDKIALDVAMGKGDAESLFKIVDKYTKPVARPGAAAETAPGTAPAAGTAPGTAAPPTGIPGAGIRPSPSAMRIPVTAEEKEAAKRQQEREEAVQRAEETELATAGAKRTGAAIDAGSMAVAKVQTAKEIQTLIDTEGMNQYFGAFNKPNDIFSAIVTLARRAQESNSQGIDKSQLDNVISNLTLNLPKSANETMEQFKARKQQVIDRAAMAASRIAEMELYYSQLIKGQGQITEGEREILRRAAINPRFDTPNVIMAKAKAIEAISNFEKWRADTLEQNPKMTLAQLKGRDDYKREEAKRISAVQDAMKPLLPKGTQQAPRAGGGLTMDAINQRANELGVR